MQLVCFLWANGMWSSIKITLYSLWQHNSMQLFCFLLAKWVCLKYEAWSKNLDINPWTFDPTKITKSWYQLASSICPKKKCSFGKRVPFFIGAFFLGQGGASSKGTFFPGHLVHQHLQIDWFSLCRRSNWCNVEREIE